MIYLNLGILLAVHKRSIDKNHELPSIMTKGVRKAGIVFVTFIGIIAVFYMSASAYLWAMQTRYIFKPDRILEKTPADLGLEFEDVYISLFNRSRQLEKLHAWWVPATYDTGKTILYLHGSAQNISSNVSHVKRFHKMGLSVFIISYRGYGISEGSFPAESQVNQDAEAAWNFLVDSRKIDPSTIIIYGHSLGGAIGIQLALNHPEAGGLIAEATFTSIYDMAMLSETYRLFPLGLFLHQRFESISKVGSLKLPVLYIHGTKDDYVPMGMSQNLYAGTFSPKKLTLIPGGGHSNNASIGGRLYLDSIEAFVTNYVR
jgi:pimeloyl-ACP methyl ester carboxylesterase